MAFCLDFSSCVLPQSIWVVRAKQVVWSNAAMFDSFSDWAAIPILIQLGIITLWAISGFMLNALRCGVDWRTYRSATSLTVLANIPDKEPNAVAQPGNVVVFTAFYSSPRNPVLQWKHLSPVTFIPIGDMGLEPLDGLTVRPVKGMAYCRFAVTRQGRLSSVVAYSGPVRTHSQLDYN